MNVTMNEPKKRNETKTNLNEYVTNKHERHKNKRSWGSPDILPMFAEHVSNVETYMYGEHDEDFSSGLIFLKLKLKLKLKLQNKQTNKQTNNKQT